MIVIDAERTKLLNEKLVQLLKQGDASAEQEDKQSQQAKKLQQLTGTTTAQRLQQMIDRCAVLMLSAVAHALSCAALCWIPRLRRVARALAS